MFKGQYARALHCDFRMKSMQSERKEEVEKVRRWLQ